MTWLYAAQFAVPLILIGWLAWVPARSGLGFVGEPHLHVHAQGQGPTEAPLGGDPRPIQFNSRFPVRGDRIEAP